MMQISQAEMANKSLERTRLRRAAQLRRYAAKLKLKSVSGGVVCQATSRIVVYEGPIMESKL